MNQVKQQKEVTQESKSSVFWVATIALLTSSYLALDVYAKCCSKNEVRQCPDGKY